MHPPKRLALANPLSLRKDTSSESNWFVHPPSISLWQIPPLRHRFSTLALLLLTLPPRKIYLGPSPPRHATHQWTPMRIHRSSLSRTLKRRSYASQIPTWNMNWTNWTVCRSPVPLLVDTAVSERFSPSTTLLPGASTALFFSGALTFRGFNSPIFCKVSSSTICFQQVVTLICVYPMLGQVVHFKNVFEWYWDAPLHFWDSWELQHHQGRSTINKIYSICT